MMVNCLGFTWLDDMNVENRILVGGMGYNNPELE